MKLILFLILTIAFLFSRAQNLVPNPSFEEYDACPNSLNNMSDCNDWSSFRGSTDYYNNCSSTMGFSNPSGHQMARTGEAYSGFINAFYANTSQEQLGAELLSPLEIGVRYYVSFYVSCAYDSIQMVNIASNKMGARFTTYQYSDPMITTILPNNCQIYTNTIITDTLNWVKVSGSFVADSAYRYVIIGSFFDRMHVDSINLPYPHQYYSVSYYYLDDVCVSTDPILCNVDIDCVFELPSAFSPNGDNVNDEYEWVQNCSGVGEFEMRIYNRWGELVFSTNDYTVGWNGRYKNEEQPVDVYAYYIEVKSINGKREKRTGSFTLLR